jgi:predicted regulator of Ras-like GTPase activity (Roadblock/LC7/MglB family)
MSLPDLPYAVHADDLAGIHRVLERFLDETQARSCLLVDRDGPLVATAGDVEQLDITAFATLAAADVMANDRMAQLVGASAFTSLTHEGGETSIFLTDVARRFIFVVLFDTRTTLGLVRWKTKDTVHVLTTVVQTMLSRGTSPRPTSEFLADADAALDRLFG